MTTATETDLELIHALDFDPETACELFQPCEHEAAWWAIHPCCNAHFAACEECRALYVERTPMWVKTFGAVLRCTRCDGAMSPANIGWAHIKDGGR